MPFEKGNKLGAKGAGVRDAKNRQWEDIGAYLLATGSQRFINELDGLEGKEFIQGFKEIIEYFKPKRAREDGKGNADTGTKIFIGDESRAQAKDALDDFIG